MMGQLTHLLALFAGLSLAASAAQIPPSESESQLQFNPPQKCPEIRGRYACGKPFLLSYPTGKRGKAEMRVVHSTRDGYSLFLFESSDGTDGFWAVGDGAPHAFESDDSAWGYKSIDTEANCPKPTSLEIRYLIQTGKKKSPSRAGLLTFNEKKPGLLTVSARPYPNGMKKSAKVDTFHCERVEDF